MNYLQRRALIMPAARAGDISPGSFIRLKDTTWPMTAGLTLNR
jgi:hypothetical protein